MRFKIKDIFDYDPILEINRVKDGLPEMTDIILSKYIDTFISIMPTFKEINEHCNDLEYFKNKYSLKKFIKFLEQKGYEVQEIYCEIL